MRYTVCMSLRFVLTAALTLVFAVGPSSVVAQSAEREQLRATIMAQIIQDPRSASIPPEQLQLLVDALSQEATEQEIAVEDILWQPAIVFGAAASEAPISSAPACESPVSFACVVAEAFGFVGDNPTVPLYLLVASGLLILLITRMRRHHHELGHFDEQAQKLATASSKVGTL